MTSAQSPRSTSTTVFVTSSENESTDGFSDDSYALSRHRAGGGKLQHQQQQQLLQHQQQHHHHSRHATSDSEATRTTRNHVRNKIRRSGGVCVIPEAIPGGGGAGGIVSTETTVESRSGTLQNSKRFGAAKSVENLTRISSADAGGSRVNKVEVKQRKWSEGGGLTVNGGGSGDKGSISVVGQSRKESFADLKTKSSSSFSSWKESVDSGVVHDNNNNQNNNNNNQNNGNHSVAINHSGGGAIQHHNAALSHFGATVAAFGPPLPEGFLNGAAVPSGAVSGKAVFKQTRTDQVTVGGAQIDSGTLRKSKPPSYEDVLAVGGVQQMTRREATTTTATINVVEDKQRTSVSETKSAATYVTQNDGANNINNNKNNNGTTKRLGTLKYDPTRVASSDDLTSDDEANEVTRKKVVVKKKEKLNESGTVWRHRR